MKKLLIALALSAPMHAQAAEICNFFFDVEAFNKDNKHEFRIPLILDATEINGPIFNEGDYMAKVESYHTTGYTNKDQKQRSVKAGYSAKVTGNNREKSDHFDLEVDVNQLLSIDTKKDGSNTYQVANVKRSVSKLRIDAKKDSGKTIDLKSDIYHYKVTYAKVCN